ncbi:MAG: sigma-70 family RNA polymerase sigma factor [Chitinophagales bacterium]
MEKSGTIITINGIIQDVKTGELLPGANIYLKSDRMNSTYSNDQGRFLLEVKNPEPQEVLVITSAGYIPYKNTVPLAKNLNIKINLSKRKTDRAQQDQELVESALKGNQLSYGKLMARYRDSIFFMIQKMVNNRDDAEDLTIEAFGKAFSSLHKYSPDYAFSTWLYRIAINNCIDFIRKKRLETFSLDEPIGGDEEGTPVSRNIQSEGLDPEEGYIKQQRILLMRNVIERLNPKYRRLIELRYLKELSYDEIAKTMNLPLGTVKAQLFRAKELLYNILKKTKGRY